jgi:hypothetical protein
MKQFLITITLAASTVVTYTLLLDVFVRSIVD